MAKLQLLSVAKERARRIEKRRMFLNDARDRIVQLFLEKAAPWTEDDADGSHVAELTLNGFSFCLKENKVGIGYNELWVCYHPTLVEQPVRLPDMHLLIKKIKDAELHLRWGMSPFMVKRFDVNTRWQVALTKLLNLPEPTFDRVRIKLLASRRYRAFAEAESERLGF